MEMIWEWWGMMALTGLVVGAVAAWTTEAARVFMKTLAVPLVLIATRFVWPGLYPVKNAPIYVFLDFLILAVTGLLADYLVGLKLGRHGRDGVRTDSVGH